MKHPNRANQIAPPFDQFEHMRLVGAVNIRMPQVFNRSPIAGLGNSENFKPQLSEARESAAGIHRNFMTAAENEPLELRINLRNQRALVSRIGSIERRDGRSIATLPRSFPNLDSRTHSHGSKLTRTAEEWKQFPKAGRNNQAWLYR